MTTGEKLLDFLVELGTTVGLKLVYAALIIFVGLKLTKAIVKRLRHNQRLIKTAPGAYTFIISFVSIALHVVIFITAAMVLGIDTASLVTVLASAGVAIGLALQGALSNFVGGLMILVFKPFGVGDFIETGSYTGTVSEITVFYTILTTLDNKRVTLPNGSLTNAAVVNYSAEEMRRVDITFSVGYDSNIEQVKTLLLAQAEKHPKVLKSPVCTARLIQQNESSLDFTLRAWCATADYWDVFFDLNEGVKQTFDEHGIAIPFPQLDVHLDK